ncbi:hypothetical protein TNCV_3339371 [Trichonephila clavipes]|nr:hypothetical protein TNCV_3339371 [Trichonephila clavipes]
MYYKTKTYFCICKVLKNTRYKAIDDEPRDFKPLSSDEGDTPFSILPHHANRRTLNLDIFNMHQTPLHNVSSVAPGLEPAIRRPRVRNHDHKATAAYTKR